MDTSSRPSLKQQEALADLLRGEGLPTASDETKAALWREGWATYRPRLNKWVLLPAGLAALRATAAR